MKYLLVALILGVSPQLNGQSKVIPASASSLTGIKLPDGSKQDTRGLSKGSARILLEMESKNVGTEISDTEVFTLPTENKSGYTADKLIADFKKSGWIVIPDENDNKYWWLQKSNSYVMVYYSVNDTNCDLYFGLAKTTPAINSLTDNTSPQTVVVVPDPGKNKTDIETSKPEITGTWFTTSSISNNITHSYIKKQYTFNSDGTYTFYKKTFDISYTFLLLTRENGTYKIEGDQITLSPLNSVTEKWNKKDRADQWGELISSEKGKLEKTTYQFSKQYFSGIQEWNLVLKTDTETHRDGKYSSNSTFPNSYLYSIPPSKDYLIELPQESKSVTLPTTAPPVTNTGGYTFNATNWDDGWVSTIEDDKVVVSKNNIKVYIYYPLPFDDEARSMQGQNYFWEKVIKKEFKILSTQNRNVPGEILHAPYLEGNAVNLKTNQSCFAALYVGAANGIMYPTLAIVPDINTLNQTFPKASDFYESDLHAMRNYNKFAIGKNDVVGDWVGGDSQAMNYYNAYNGNYVGMNAAVSSDVFHIHNDGTYSSTHNGATGMVGTMKTYQQEYKGNCTVSNWEIIMDKRFDGKTDTFYAYFEAVKGGRVLHLQNKKYTATWFHLVKSK
jgi:hypothetical protein